MPEIVTDAVTVDQALARGVKVIMLPVAAIFISVMFGGVFLNQQFHFPGWIDAVAFGAATLFSWLYWNLVSTPWQIWAYEHVRDVYELRAKAISSNFICGKESALSFLVLTSAAQRAKLLALQDKFTHPDFHSANKLQVPSEMLICFSKDGIKSEVIVLAACMSACLFVLIIHLYRLSAILALPCIYIAYTIYRHITVTKPQLIVNDKGIQTGNKFYDWKEISEESVTGAGGVGRGPALCSLDFTCHGGNISVNLDDLDIDTKFFAEALVVYRKRSGTRR